MSKKTVTAPKPWQGRFEGTTDALIERFTASVQFDQRLYAVDIQGSIAHVQTLAKGQVLTATECEDMIAGLKQIQQEIEQEKFVWSPVLEDVHMNIEARLTDLIGDSGKKLHTGRSRNDQVATDIRLYLRYEIDVLQQQIAALQQVIVDLAGREVDTVMPGYTHLQLAQPVSFGHHMMAWFEMLKRDRARFADVRKRVNVLPLGSAALAGTGFNLDRTYTAELLGFDAISDNSLDAVSDRDFAIEFCAAGAVLMMHLSRFAEELILWATASFHFIELPDAWCTGSSIMPQKKNPDGAELVRGKSARVFGNLTALLVLMKAQTLAYNRDNQEDKEPLFDTVDTASLCVQVMTGIIGALQIDRQRLLQAAQDGYATATDLADYLTRKAIPFREAHALTGRIVKLGIEQACALVDLSLVDLQRICPHIEADVYEVLGLYESLAAKSSHGGTAPQQVTARIAQAQDYLKQ